MDKISGDNLRSSYYEQYRHHLNSIWENSKYVWSFGLVIFGAYGAVFLKLIENISNKIAIFYNHVESFLCLLGLCISLLWIAMAKSCKTWQRWYEEKIICLEHDRKYFTFPRDYAMGGTTNRVADLDDSFLTQKNGKFSTGKLNIIIAQTIWVLWLFLFVFHQFILPIKTNISFSPIMLAFCIAVYCTFLYVLKRNSNTSYLRNEDYKEEFIFETYLRIEKAEEALNSVIYVSGGKCEENLLDYFLNQYRALSFDLYNILHSSERVYDCDEWLTKPFESLFATFKREYMSPNNEEMISLNEYVKQIRQIYEKYKNILKREYDV